MKPKKSFLPLTRLTFFLSPLFLLCIVWWSQLYYTNETLTFVDCTGTDTEVPTASNPVAIISECDVPPPDPEVVTDEADNCPGPIIVAYVSDVSNNMTCPETITRTYSVTDQAGNSINVTQTITIIDDTNPTITCPPHITIESGTSDQPSSTGFPTSTDNCTTDPAHIFFDNLVPGNCPVVNVLERNWAAIDSCGNTTFCLQNITVTDTSPPIITCPADITVESGDQELPAVTGYATVTDNADPNVDLTYADNVILTGICPVAKIIERTWTATDDCGNTSSCLQTISATDLLSPVISCPADLTINFGESELPSNTGTAIASDSADPNPDIVYSDQVTVIGTCPAIQTIDRTWTATDNCGFSSSCIQVITVINLTAPEITCPSTSNNLPIEIFENEPNENASDPGVINITHESSLGGSIGQPASDQVDHWTIEDGISGQVTLQFNLSLHPLTIAALTCFSDQARTIMVNSSALLPFDPPITSTLDPTFFYSIIIQNPLAVGEPYDLLVTGSALMSNEGETALECPPNFSATPVGPNTPQHASIDPSVTGMASFTGNIGPVVLSYQDILTGPDLANCPEVWTVERSWAVTDTCGQVATCTEFFIFNDYLPPVVICPANTTINSGSNDQPPATGTATGSDNCDPAIDLSFSDDITISENCSFLQVIDRTWTAVDDCGNTSICIQTINIGDFSPPVINCPSGITIPCNSSDLPAFTGFATATDIVDNSVTISYSDVEIFTGSCPVFKQIHRTWTAVDDCGNSSSCLQLISVTDTDVPLISCPPNIVIECGMSINPSNTGTASGADNCGNLQIDFSNNTGSGCGNTGSINRTWTATDICGSTSSCIQVITIEDTNPPFIICPTDITVECGSSLDPAITGLGFGTDGCGGVLVDFNDNVNAVCGLSELITRTWTVTDECGNSSICSQIITVSDSTPPEISCPPGITVECGSSTAPAATGQATGTDLCGSILFEFSDDIVSTCGLTTILIRTWTATDDCGNLSSCDQGIIVDDTIPPAISCPSDIVVECGDPIDPGSTGVATGSDACGMVQIDFIDDVIPVCGTTEVLTRFWTAIDECGNVNSCVQAIILGDPPPPILTCPLNVSLLCGSSSDPSETGQATSVLGCGVVQINFSDSVAPSCGLTSTITRTWTATDECNNNITCDQVITFFDNAPPVTVCPQNITVACGSPTDPANTGIGTGTDNCGNVQISSSDFFVTGCGPSGTIIRTWTGIDDCGNSSSCPQLITIEDTTPPAIICPPNTTVQCGSSTDPSITGTPSGVEACGTVQFNFSDNVFPVCPSTPAITRTWTATDECLNSNSCIQVIVLDDSPPPVLFCPSSVSQECGVSLDPSNTGQATSIFGCEPVVITFLDNLSPTCGSSGTISRTWTAADACDRIETCIQTIQLFDTTPPVVTCPPNLVVDCSSSIDPIDIGSATVNDLCGDASLFFSDVNGSGCGNSGIITRTWGAFDGCNNFNQCQQLITVTNTTTAEIICPSDISVNFGESTSPTATGTATFPDGCGSSTIGYFDSTIPGCGLSITILRLWTAVDECGNTSQCVQTISVIDPASTMLSAIVTNQSDLVNPDGAIDLSVTSGNPPFSYAWSNGSTSEDISSLTGSMNYSVTVTDISGCTVTGSYFVDQEGMPSVEFCITAFLASMFDPFAVAPAPQLTTTLRDQDLLPLAQPFNVPPWNYNGPESFQSLAFMPADMTEWLLLRLRPSSNPSIITHEQAVILHSSGIINDISGLLPEVLLDQSDDYWLELIHINHLPISTEAPLIVPSGGGQVCHDFTTAMNQAYIDPVLISDPMMELQSVNGMSYGMIPANVQNLDCMIDANDLNLLFIHYLESSIYAPWDVNRDGVADINDVNMLFSTYNGNAHKPY